MKTIYRIALLLFTTALLTSCSKDWLDAKSDKALVIPSSIKDLQGILDNTTVFNNNFPGLGEIGSGDYYMVFSAWNALSSKEEKNAYSWATDIYEGSPERGNWGRLYAMVFYANNALKGIAEITPSNADKDAWNNVKGSALFYRSMAFFHLAQLYAKPYDETTAATDLGIPLRLSPDINEKSTRASLQQTYAQITNDLQEAVRLLPPKPSYYTRPSDAAAFALLANTFLIMGNYDKALLYADSCLQIQPTLLDYNTLTVTSSTSNYPVPKTNSEIIFYGQIFNFTSFIPPRPVVDTALKAMYSVDDLRRSVFFKSASPVFFGHYTQSRNLFGGLAINEMYLVRAECNARKGNVTAAMDDLDALLIKRWKNTATYTPVVPVDAEDALRIILTERRKELPFRGIRWWDLRRLNKDPRFDTTLTRVLNDQTYTLPPNDARYVLPIPEEEIRISGIEQNQR